MRDITPKYKFTKEFRFFEEVVKETERDLTWHLNDFEWKKEPFYPPEEPAAEVEEEEE